LAILLKGHCNPDAVPFSFGPTPPTSGRRVSRIHRRLRRFKVSGYFASPGRHPQVEIGNSVADKFV
jgi:hypothetical protein